MTKPSRPRRGRPPRGAERLSRDAILEAALAVIDRDGVAQVSMRTVAAQMAVDPKSLYNHVDGKEGLLDAVAEQVLASLRLPAPSGVLEDDLRAIAYAFRRATLAHPRAAALVLTRQLSSLAALAPVEAVLAVLRRAGFAPPEAVHLLRSLLALVIGTLLREVNAGPSFGVSDQAGIALRRKALERAGLPTLRESAAQLARCDHAYEFDFAVELMIAAVAARRARLPPPGAAALSSASARARAARPAGRR